jgi:hypothetical protein
VFCSNNNLVFLQSSEWLSKTVRLFKSLLETGDALDNGRRYRLSDFILPIANLSVLESHKGMKSVKRVVVLIALLSTLELIGNLVVSLLLRVIFGDHKDNINTLFLTREKQEASRVFPPTLLTFF